MNYILGILFFIIVFSLFYTYVLRKEDPASYQMAVSKQPNVFRVPKDSAEICWKRAKDFLTHYASLISGGDLQENDSLLFIPYYNDHQKGTSVKIEKHIGTDSATFQVEWWDSQQLSLNGSKRISLYMQQAIDR